MNVNCYPQMCIRCGVWIHVLGGTTTAVCNECHFDNKDFAEFFVFCHLLENELTASYAYQERLYEARNRELNYGWLPDILAILSTWFWVYWQTYLST